MRIEKINDNQIKCTLTKRDLADRQLKLHELAYGTDKARSLFRDMMQQASADFGFEADDIPLMIEAIPLPNECIVLIITKVEDPEELDTRFSKFAPAPEGYEEASDSSDLDIFPSESASNSMLDMFKHILNKGVSTGTDKASQDSTGQVNKYESAKLYNFPDLDSVIAVAHILKDTYHGENTLYRLVRDNTYSLVVHKGSHTPAELGKILNILSEYAVETKYTYGCEAYMEERGGLMLYGEALQKLALI